VKIDNAQEDNLKETQAVHVESGWIVILGAYYEQRQNQSGHRKGEEEVMIGVLE
jgi:hypothetical protein